MCTGSPAPPGWHIHMCGHRRFVVSPSTVSGPLRSYQETGHYRRRAGQGCQRAFTQQQVCYFVQGRTGGALSEPYNMTSSRPNCQKQTPWGRHKGLTSSTGTRAHSPAPCSLLGIRQRTPEKAGLLLVLFIDETRFQLSTCDRRERVWRLRCERYASVTSSLTPHQINHAEHEWSGEAYPWRVHEEILRASRSMPRCCQECIQAAGGHTHAS